MSSVSSAGGNSYYYTMQKKAFDKLDTDGNGTLDQNEVQAGKPKSVTNDQATKIYNNMDTDKSGAVTLDEFVAGTSTGAGSGLINQLPTDAIDVLLKLQQGGGQTSTGSDDATGSGGGDAGGQSASDGATYDPLDTNKDGVVSEDELLAAYPEDAPKSATETAAVSTASSSTGTGADASDATDTDSDSDLSQEQLQALAMLTTPPRLMGPDFFGSDSMFGGGDSQFGSQFGGLASLFGSASGSQNGAANLFQLLENEQDGTTSASV